MLYNNAKVGVFVSSSFFFFFFGGGGGGGGEVYEKFRLLEGGLKKMKASRGGTKFIYGLLQILPAHPR